MKPREVARSSPGNAAETRAGNGQVGAAKHARKPLDGRTRAAKRWRSLYTHYLALAGQQHDPLCRALASLLVERERLDLALARGEPTDALLLVRVSGEIRRLLTRLGLDAEPEVVDGTSAAIAALHANGEAHA